MIGPLDTRRMRRTWPPRVSPVTADLVVVGATAALQVLSVSLWPPATWPVGLLLAAAETVPLLWRRRWPLATLGIVASAWALDGPLGAHLAGAYLAVPFAVYAVGYHSGSLRWLVPLLGVAWTVWSGVQSILSPVRSIQTNGSVVSVRDVVHVQFGWTGVAIVAVFLMGEIARTRRAYLVELEARVARQERERDQDRRRAMEQERLRIARELHDVVAHHVSAIAVDAAAERAARPEDGGAEAMTRIAATARLALTELSQLLGVLRREDERRPPRAPGPGLEQVPELVAEARAGGLDVDLVVSGDPGPLPAPLDRSAYRIVQEAVTNARRHAAGARVEVRLHHGAGLLEIRVTSSTGMPLPEPAAGGGGHGLIGMRERVEVFGGRFDAGPRPAGGFLVSADLPVEPPP